jgi:hypothetical protein
MEDPGSPTPTPQPRKRFKKEEGDFQKGPPRNKPCRLCIETQIKTFKDNGTIDTCCKQISKSVNHPALFGIANQYQPEEERQQPSGLADIRPDVEFQVVEQERRGLRFPVMRGSFLDRPREGAGLQLLLAFADVGLFKRRSYTAWLHSMVVSPASLETAEKTTILRYAGNILLELN